MGFYERWVSNEREGRGRETNLDNFEQLLGSIDRANRESVKQLH